MIRNTISKIAFAVCILLRAAYGASAIAPDTDAEYRYTNADFYKDGVFQKDVAKEAVRRFILQQGELYSEKMDSLLWVSSNPVAHSTK